MWDYFKLKLQSLGLQDWFWSFFWLNKNFKKDLYLLRFKAMEFWYGRILKYIDLIQVEN